MRAANQANAKHSTGPSTPRGKSITRYNAARHWGRAEGIRQMMPVLGEDPAEYEAVRDGLYHALGPCDEFEAMLVDDMTDIHWRLRRMISSETGAERTGSASLPAPPLAPPLASPAAPALPGGPADGTED